MEGSSNTTRRIVYEENDILGGKGSYYNEVFRGKLMSVDGTETMLVAVKRTQFKKGDPRHHADRFLGHQMRLNHPNIVKYLHFENDNTFR